MEAPEKVLKRSMLVLGNIIVREERLFEQKRETETDRDRQRQRETERDRETEIERYQGRCMYVCVWECGKG